MGRDSLPPGFRFHPTDVELVKYYLKRRVLGKKLCFEAISEVDIYKFVPWDLPEKSYLISDDLKWYFFCPRERKYATGARMNRSTNSGYWKTTGKDRPVRYSDEVVGHVKTLIFHIGKAPKGDRTDWVMHEYRLDEKDLADKGVAQDAYVLCVVFKKDGLGPRNGAQYGAPFKEEDWNDDEEVEEKTTSREGFLSCGPLVRSGSPLPVTHRNSIVTSTNRPEKMYVGESMSCPSQNQATVYHSCVLFDSAFTVVVAHEEANVDAASILKPAHERDTHATVMAPQVAEDDDELAAMLNTFIVEGQLALSGNEDGTVIQDQNEENPFVLGENDKTEMVDNPQKNGNVKSSNLPNVHDIYDGLGDLGNCNGLDGYSESIWDQMMLQNIHGRFLGRDDFECSLNDISQSGGNSCCDHRYVTDAFNVDELLTQLTESPCVWHGLFKENINNNCS